MARAQLPANRTALFLQLLQHERPRWFSGVTPRSHKSVSEEDKGWSSPVKVAGRLPGGGTAPDVEDQPSSNRAVVLKCFPILPMGRMYHGDPLPGCCLDGPVCVPLSGLQDEELLDQPIDVAVEDSTHVANLAVGPVIFDHLVWLKNVRANL